MWQVQVAVVAQRGRHEPLASGGGRAPQMVIIVIAVQASVRHRTVRDVAP